MSKYLLLLFFCFSLISSAFGQAKSGSNGDNYDISYQNTDGKTFSAIEISGAPSNAYVTSVSFTVNIDHDDIGEVDYWVGTDNRSSQVINAWRTGDDSVWDGFDDSHSASNLWSLDLNDNQSPNQTWYLVAQDLTSGNNGRIDSWSIEVNYSIPQPADLSLSDFSDPEKFSSDGGSKTGKVCNDGDLQLSWSQTQNQDWYDVEPSSGTLGEDECKNVKVTVDKYNGRLSTNANLLFQNGNNINDYEGFRISQTKPANIYVSDHPGGNDKVWEVNVAGAAETISLKNSGEETGYWSVSKSDNWITITDNNGDETTGGDIEAGDSDYFQITIDDNYDNPDDQAGYIKIYDVDNEELFRLDIIQDGDPPDPSDLRTNFDDDYDNIGYQQTDITERIYNDGGETLSWEAFTNEDWITADPSEGDIAPGSYDDVTITIDENPDQQEREGRISFFNDDDTNDSEGVNITQNAAPVVNNAPIARGTDISGQPTELYPNGLYSVSTIYIDPDGKSDLKSAQLMLSHPDGNSQHDIVLNWNRESNEFYPWLSEDGKNYVDTLLTVDVVEVNNGYQLTWNFVIEPNWPETESGIKYGVRALDMSDSESNPIWDFDGSSASFQNPTGVTVLTHGLYIRGEEGFSGDFDPALSYWEGYIGALLNRYNGGMVFEYDRNSAEFVGIYNSDWNIKHVDEGGELILVHNWAEPSQFAFSGEAESAAEVLLSAVIKLDRELSNYRIIDLNNPSNSQSLHIIGHSRGTTVASEFAQRLGNLGIKVGYMTTLDVHDYDELDVPRDQKFHDPAVQVWENVIYADNFYQNAEVPIVPSGRNLVQINSNYNGSYSLDKLIGFSTPSLNGGNHDHERVKTWYLGTIDPDSESSNWYTDGSGYNTGFSLWRKRGGHSNINNYNQFNPEKPKTSLDDFKNLEPFSGSSLNYHDDDLNNELLFNSDFDLPDLDLENPAGWHYHTGGGTAHIENGELLLEYDQFTSTGQFDRSYRTHNPFYIPFNATSLKFDFAVYTSIQSISGQYDKLEVLLDEEVIVDDLWLEDISNGSYTVDISQHADKVRTLTFRITNKRFSASVGIDNIKIITNSGLAIYPLSPVANSPAQNEAIFNLTPVFSWSEFQHGGDNDNRVGYQLRVVSDSDNDKIVYDTGLIENVSSLSHTYSPGSYTGTDGLGQQRVSESLEWDKKYHWHIRYLDSSGDWSPWSKDTEGDYQWFTTKEPVSPIVNLTSPNSQNLVLLTGSVHLIKWETFNFTGDVKIELYQGGVFQEQIALVDEGVLSYSWSIPNFISTGNKYRIRISSVSDNSITDESDNTFTIYNEGEAPESFITISAPNGGETWQKGSTQTISWEDNISENVAIQLMLNGEVATNISQSTESDGEFNWNLTNGYEVSDQYRIRITSLDDETVFDESENTFSITDSTTNTPTYTVSLSANPNEGGTVSGAGTYEENTTVNLSAVPSEGYLFQNWTEENEVVSEDSLFNFSVTKNRFLTANFVQPDSTEDSTDTSNPIILERFAITAEIVEEGESWTDAVNSLFGSDYRVADWNDLKTYHESGNDILALFDSLGLTKYNASVALTRNGDDTFSSSSSLTRYYFASRHEGNRPGHYLAHENIDGFTISLGSWSGGRKLLAYRESTIEKDSVIIVADAAQKSHGSVEGDGIYDYNSSVKLTAFPKTGYEFSNWSENSTIVSTTNPYKFNAEVNRSLKANFVESTDSTIFVNLNVMAENYSGFIDDQFTIPITVDSLKGTEISSFEFVINYDQERIKIDSVGKGEALDENWELIHNTVSGNIFVSGASQNKLSESGELVKLKATSLTSGAGEIAFKNFFFNEGNPTVNTTNGSINIAAFRCGDASGNGLLNAGDASTILQHTVRISPPYPLVGNDSLAADVTGNGWISAFDASQVLKHEVGLPAILNCTEQLAKAAPLNVQISWNSLQDVEELSEFTVPIVVAGDYDQITSADISIPKIDDVELVGINNKPEDWQSHTNEADNEIYLSMYGISPMQGNRLVELRFRVEEGAGDKSIYAKVGVNENLPVKLDPVSVFDLPEEFILSQNYPNPFNPTTTINFSVPELSNVRIVVYNTLGQVVAELVNEEFAPGSHSAIWDASGNSSGVYFYRLTSGNIILTQKMLLIK